MNRWICQDLGELLKIEHRSINDILRDKYIDIRKKSKYRQKLNRLLADIKYNFKDDIIRDKLDINGVRGYSITILDDGMKFGDRFSIDATVNFPYIRRSQSWRYLQQATINHSTQCGQTVKKLEYRLRCMNLALKVANYLNVYFDVY